MYRIFMYANVSVLLKDTADARTRIVCNTVIQLFIMIERKTYENSSYHEPFSFITAQITNKSWIYRVDSIFVLVFTCTK